MIQELVTKEYLNKKIKDFFIKLKFNEELHKYTCEDRILTSVSKLIENFSEKIDWKKKAYDIAYTRNTTGDKLYKDWENEKNISIVKGHSTHHFAELLGDNARKPITNQEKAILKFWSTVDKDRYIRVDREVRMYHKKLFFSGTCDFILYDTWNDSFILGDYKTNKDLFKNYKGKKLLYPFSFLLDQPLSKYGIQLSLYQILLEQLNIPVSERWIIWTLPDNKCEEFQLPLASYKLYKMKDRTNILLDWLHKQEAFYHYEK